MLWLLLACADDKSSPDTAGEPTETAAPEPWTPLSGPCEAPATLPADPLTMEGSVRVQQVDGSGFLEAIDVDLEGDLAHVVGQGGYLIFDVTDPSAPTKLYGPWESGRGKLHRVEPLADGIVATSQRDEGVYLWDASAPAESEIVGEIAGSGMEGLAWVDGLLYVTVRDEGLRVYDVSDPAAPALVGSAAGLEAPWELASSGDGWLYAADNTLGVVPIDIRDPGAPLVGEPLALEGGALHVRYAEDRLYVAIGGDGVAILDVSERASPQLLHTLSTGGSAVMSAVGDGILWVVDHEGLAAFDLRADPPTPIQQERTEQFALAVDASGARAFVGDWNIFEIWALSEDEAPALDLPSETLRYADGVGETTITNRGAGTLTLSGASAGDAAVLVDVSATTLDPGASATLRVSGLTADTTLCLASDDPDEPLRELSVLASAAPPAGVAAPDFALQGIDGLTYRLSEQLGHPVLLSYFATW